MDIDIVVLWVDGNDPAWLEEKTKYLNTKTTDANAVNRFRDWGLMKYWFRAIENYAPWVRKIHFVTWGHTPDFLKLEHPKLHVVRHEDFLPEECLPTFNSCAIEMSIHKIEGLAEHFIFFNDDMFLLRPISEQCFFCNGLPVAEGYEKFEAPVGVPMVWQSHFYNDLGIINKWFPKRDAVRANRNKFIHPAYGFRNNARTLLLQHLSKNRFVGFAFPHSASAFCKESFCSLWKAEPELLQETTSHRFRDRGDLNQWVVQWWQIASGKFYPGKIDNGKFYAESWMTDAICEAIQTQSHDMICINDPDVPIDFEMVSRRIQNAFESILPNKCSFEKEAD